MNASEQFWLMPPFTPDSRFYPASREWRVSPKLFAEIQAFCACDPRWAEKNILCHTGPGEVKLIVVLTS